MYFYTYHKLAENSPSCLLLVLVGFTGVLWTFQLYFETFHSNLESVHRLDGSLSTRRIVKAYKTCHEFKKNHIIALKTLPYENILYLTYLENEKFTSNKILNLSNVIYHNKNVEKVVGKRRKCWLPVFSYYSAMFSCSLPDYRLFCIPIQKEF